MGFVCLCQLVKHLSVFSGLGLVGNAGTPCFQATAKVFFMHPNPVQTVKYRERCQNSLSCSATLLISGLTLHLKTRQYFGHARNAVLTLWQGIPLAVRHLVAATVRKRHRNGFVREKLYFAQQAAGPLFQENILEQIGVLLMTTYLAPFEVLAVLLLAAPAGAVYMAGRKDLP